MNIVIKPLIAVLCGVLALFAALLHTSMSTKASRVAEMASDDLAIWRSACGEPFKYDVQCSTDVMAKAKTTTGVMLGAAERIKERSGSLTEDDLFMIEDLLRAAYMRESEGSLYSITANACADNLGDFCPRMLKIGAWRHHEKQIETIRRNHGP